MYFCKQSSFNNLKSLRLDCNNPRPCSTTSSKSLILNLGVLTPAVWSHGLCQDPMLLSNCFKLVVKLGMSNLRLFDGRNNLANVWKSLRGIIYHFALSLKRVRSSEFQCSFAGKIMTKSCENAGRLHAMWALCKCFALFFYIRMYIYFYFVRISRLKSAKFKYILRINPRLRFLKGFHFVCWESGSCKFVTVTFLKLNHLK